MSYNDAFEWLCVLFKQSWNILNQWIMLYWHFWLHLSSSLTNFDLISFYVCELFTLWIQNIPLEYIMCASRSIFVIDIFLLWMAVFGTTWYQLGIGCMLYIETLLHSLSLHHWPFERLRVCICCSLLKTSRCLDR